MKPQENDLSELPDDELIALMYAVLNEVEARLKYKPVDSGISDEGRTRV